MHQTRRRYLRAMAAATTGGLLGTAGCLGDGSDDNGEAGDDGGGGAYGGGGGGGADSTPTATTDADTGSTVAVNAHPTHGDILTDGAGRTLYLLTADPAGESVCTGGCADAWPPLTVESEDAVEAGPDVAASLGTTTRDDGSHQVTADDTPLYYFVQDEAAGDALGQEVNNVWFVLRPDASAVKPTVSVREHDELGPILTDADGMTLYLFTNDEGETSTCTGGCADAWPPLTVESEDALSDSVRADVGLGTTEHPEVGTMVTAADHPLYYYAQDEEPGDATGQGVGDVWYVLDPEGNVIEG